MISLNILGAVCSKERQSAAGRNLETVFGEAGRHLVSRPAHRVENRGAVFNRHKEPRV